LGDPLGHDGELGGGESWVLGGTLLSGVDGSVVGGTVVVTGG
jgi:hypothetical protein